MTYSEMQKNYADVLDAVINNRVKDALQIVAKLLVHVGSSEIHSLYQSVTDTYRSMLKYSFELAPDPEREKIYLRLKQSILELTDDIRDSWIISMNFFERRSMQERLQQFESFYAGDVNQIILMLSGNEENEKQEPDSVTQQALPETLSSRLFYFFWLKNKLTNKDKTLFEQIIEYPEIDTSLKSLLVSAMTLSHLRHFDSEKFILLYNLSKTDDPQIRQRAMIGMFLSVLSYRQRMALYPNLTERLKSIPDDKVFQERMLAILIQYIRASETEKITRKIQEEIVPEVMKMRSELEDKLNLDELLSKETFEDKNPEWENFFKDAPDVYQKLEQFSKMQIEGSDVFMGAFAMLKHFPFFKELSNWFIPFTTYNHTVKTTSENFTEDINIKTFIEGLEKSTVLCNSDKYSFIMNIQNMPSQQRKTMLELFNMELKAMNEMMEDEFKLDKETWHKIINTQYMQDLYRFFKLHPDRKEYDSLFELEVDPLGPEVLKLIYDNPKILRNLAEFYFARDRYAEALQLFEWLNEKEKSFELLEKIGFCYQITGGFYKAIESYHQAELFDKNKLWLQKKLGYCYRKTGNFEKAIEYYQMVIKSEPKDQANIAYLGQLYLDTENFEEALSLYYKVEYANPENSRVFRPIGWCSFVLGKYDIAIKYFNKIIKEKPIKSDFLNIGHCYWASEKIEEALNAYREAVRYSGNNERWFRETFIKDGKYMKAKGFEELDISLMIDYVLMES